MEKSGQDDQIAQIRDDEPTSIEDAAKGEVLPDWTPEEEAMAVRKLDFTLLSILTLALFNVAVDHSNISNALTSTILEDLSINTNNINIGAQVTLAAIVIFDLPSNLLMQRTHPQLYLSIQMICWGLVSTLQAFIKNNAEFLGTRFLLGFFQAGFVPGDIFLITLFYKREEYSSRVAIYYLGKTLSSALGSLLAAGILHLEGALGWAGWRWLFAVEGLMTVFWVLIFLLFMPQSVQLPRPRIGFNRWQYFSDRKEHILSERLRLRGAEYAANLSRPTVKESMGAMSSPRLWMHTFVTLLSACAMNGLLTYTPLMIKTFGFGAFIAERTGMRGLFVLVAATYSVVTYSTLNITPYISDMWKKFAILSLTNVGGTTIHVVNTGWLMYNTKTKTGRGIGSALIVMAANLGGLSGGQVLTQEDRPLYIQGFRKMTGIISGCWGMAAVLGLIYILDSRRQK